ncbi:carboxypeptidase-like regulatory domain-containing protein, partial [uncultured Planktosalinus sp.]|uniref:carboxypeptidase-like regulatory domain-containing protein n=1 Tax=uncultured Planktosalinus sp. TaxID=1810935 RepID=UPI0030D9E680
MRVKFLLLVVLSLSLNAWSQTKVSGKVLDTFNEPIPFANVVFKNSNEGTITDENGRFYVESDATYSTLIISFVGYQTKELELDRRTSYDLVIKLEEESS